MTAGICETCHILSLHIFIPHSLVSALYILIHFLCSLVDSTFSSILLHFLFPNYTSNKKKKRKTFAFPSPNSLSNVPSASVAQSV
jgi:hypothetical protein